MNTATSTEAIRAALIAAATDPGRDEDAATDAQAEDDRLTYGH